MNALPYVLVGLLILPGYLFARYQSNVRYRLLSAYAIGLGIAGVSISGTGFLQLSWLSTLALYACVCIGLNGALITRIKMPMVGSSVFVRGTQLLREKWGLFSVIGLYGIYYNFAGSYDLVPSDVLRHLERLQFSLRDLNDGVNNWFEYRSGNNDYYIYYLYAIAWYLSGMGVDDFFYHISLISNLIMLCGIYLFAQAIFGCLKKQADLIALLSCVLFVLFQGFAAFPYLRYYALSATEWTMPVYFLFVLYLRDLFESSRNNKDVPMLMFLPLIALLYHQQELLFMLVVGSGMLVYYTYAAYLHQYDCPKSGYFVKPTQDFRKLALWSLGLLTVLVLIFCWAYFYKLRNEFDPRKIVGLSEFLPFLRNLYILEPNNQFYKIVALWGYVVYVFCLIFYKRLLRFSYLICGLLLPILTIFNPVFVDFFLRLTTKPVLYRFTYAVPLAMAGAFLLIYFVRGVMQAGFLVRTLYIVSIFVLLVTLFPIDSRYIKSDYSRLPWLGVVSDNQSLRYWSDMSDFIQNNLPRQTFYTDPVTAYIVRATTDSYSQGYKFYGAAQQQFNYTHYDSSTLKPLRGSYLIINLREGGLSAPGAISGHWPEDVLKLRKYYHPELLQYLSNNPSQLSLIWHQNDIRIYAIQ